MSAHSLSSKSSLEKLYTDALQARHLASKRYQENVAEDDDATLSERIRLKKAPTERQLARASEVFFDDFTSALGYDIDLLDANLLDIDGSSGRLSVRRSELLPVIALLTDAQVRYQLEGDELFLYGAEALGVVDAVS